MDQDDSSLDSLLATAADLKQRLAFVEREIAQRTQDPAALAAELRSTRSYAASATEADCVARASKALTHYGFTVIDDVIPEADVPALREEAEAAEITIAENQQAVRALMDAAEARGEPPESGLSGELPTGVELRAVRRRGLAPKTPNDIIWLPRYAQHLAHPTLIAIAKRLLDDHLRIAQLHLRPIKPGSFGSARNNGRQDTRRWHTDWPHDLSAYGAGDERLNVGCIRQPFPDVPMCLVMIWYLSDVDEDTAGTFVVPGSHRDPRNPRGPADDISVSSPVPGDLQVTARAGSVFIQDSRTWHASAAHNLGPKRVAVVNRWAPWWLAVDDYAPGGVMDTVCRPINLDEFQALPEALQPYLRHVCAEVEDTLQPEVLERAAAAYARTRWGFRFMEEHPDEVATRNEHIRVAIRTD
ncbi:MAG: hypothetical protein CMQ24_00420 [Gammaproteobacteria bacterium]|nr:hypothetical protein [Gammaproteobacteria bacterium]